MCAEREFECKLVTHSLLCVVETHTHTRTAATAAGEPPSMTMSKATKSKPAKRAAFIADTLALLYTFCLRQNDIQDKHLYCNCNSLGYQWECFQLAVQRGATQR